MADHDQEWMTQETALRHGQDPADRLLLQALADPVLDPLPENFAAQMALLAAPQADEKLELLLQYGLLGLLAMSGLVLVLPDPATLPELDGAALPGWLALVLLCLGVSAAPHFLSRRLY